MNSRSRSDRGVPAITVFKSAGKAREKRTQPTSIKKTQTWRLGPPAPFVDAMKPSVITPPCERLIDEKTLYLTPLELDTMMLEIMQNLDSAADLSSSALEVLRAAAYQHNNIEFIAMDDAPPEFDIFGVSMESSMSGSNTPLDESEFEFDVSGSDRMLYYPAEPVTPEEMGSLYLSEETSFDPMDYQLYNNIDCIPMLLY